MENRGVRLHRVGGPVPTIAAKSSQELDMNIDRRIYLTTAVVALILGSVVLLAAPRDPLTAGATLHVGAGTSNGVDMRTEVARASRIVRKAVGSGGVGSPDLPAKGV
jgi:hypothetical protein